MGNLSSIMEFLCFIFWFRKTIITKFFTLGILLWLFPLNNLLAQNCDYLSGDVLLNASQSINTPFYDTRYFIIDSASDSILQVNLLPQFTNLEKGTYAAYAVTYKSSDSIFNLGQGHLLQDITSNCMDLSNPYIFSVCFPPQLSNLENTNLEVCADETKLGLTDSINFQDEDGLLDTFSILVSIIESPDITNDFLEVDLGMFIGLQKTYTSPTLIIQHIRSPAQVQAILRAVHYYTNSTINGKRIISFQVSDGLTLSNSNYREILVSPLPQQPIQIFRKKGKNN